MSAKVSAEEFKVGIGDEVDGSGRFGKLIFKNLTKVETFLNIVFGYCKLHG